LAAAVTLGSLSGFAQPKLKGSDEAKARAAQARMKAAKEKQKAQQKAADKPAAKAEDKADKKAAKAEDKADKKAAKADDKADKAEEKADKKAAKAEEKAAKKGDDEADPGKGADEGHEPPGLEQKRKTRDARRKARKEGLKKRWGDTIQMPEIKAELRRNARRMARLQRIKELATDKENEKLLERVDKLITMETGRHERRMIQLSQQAVAAKTGGAASGAPSTPPAASAAAPAAAAASAGGAAK
jgi:hypothetical protein